MSSIRAALIIAHFSKNGEVRNDTIEALHVLKNYFEKIIFVSTNLNPEESLKIPPYVDFIVRENIGYDFYSYREGINLLFQEDKSWQITLMNTSFIIFDPEKLYKKYIINELKNNLFDFYGLSKSHEKSTHIQSYLFTFSHTLVESEIFIVWWNRMEPLNIRDEVINKYEIGLSQYLTEAGINLIAAVECDNKLIAWLKGTRHIENPTHAKYQKIFNQYGICKIELLRDNPFDLKLQPFLEQINRNKKYQKIFQEYLQSKEINN